MEKIIDIGQYVTEFVNWLRLHGRPFFDFIKNTGNASIEGIEWIFVSIPFYLMIPLFTLLAFKRAGKGIAVFTLLGLGLIYLMGYWIATMQTLALILSSTVIALALAVPLGIWSAKNSSAQRIIRPILDLMQTMPAFVYLIPAVLFFSIGKVPGAFATIIFAMPPAVRLTSLGIQQVPKDVLEAGRSLGATNRQVLLKVELPLALRTILTGVNQTILLSLSMVVIAGMIAAGGLGEKVLEGISNLDVGLGFESGISVVILAIILDRITQSFNKPKGLTK
ncbi:ABC transporter permease [Sphingobacterium sp. LRF_L2]|uniref:ABC transporter permease n=1 Tax=Sphingobacterium sp. LRF_L2 TaxID=3369421 RepID=UPI003F647B76